MPFIEPITALETSHPIRMSNGSIYTFLSSPQSVFRTSTFLTRLGLMQLSFLLDSCVWSESNVCFNFTSGFCWWTRHGWRPHSNIQKGLSHFCCLGLDFLVLHLVQIIFRDGESGGSWGHQPREAQHPDLEPMKIFMGLNHKVILDLIALFFSSDSKMVAILVWQALLLA